MGGGRGGDGHSLRPRDPPPSAVPGPDHLNLPRSAFCEASPSTTKQPYREAGYHRHPHHTVQNTEGREFRCFAQESPVGGMRTRSQMSDLRDVKAPVTHVTELQLAAHPLSPSPPRLPCLVAVPCPPCAGHCQRDRPGNSEGERGGEGRCRRKGQWNPCETT